MQGPIEKLGQQHLMQDAQLLQPLLCDWFVETSLNSALYWPNKFGGGCRQWAWDATSKQLLTSDGLISLTEYSWAVTNYGITQYGAPAATLDGSSEALVDQTGRDYQNPYSNTFFVWQWCKPDTGFTTGDRAVVSKWDEDSNLRCWMLYWLAASTAFQAIVSVDGTATISCVSSVSVDAADVDIWQFVAFYYQPSTLLRIYVAAATDTSLTVDSNTTSIPASINDDVNCEFHIGNSMSAERYWLGDISIGAGWGNVQAANVNSFANRQFQLTRRFYQA